ncbi:MAG: deoxyhypusine synthase [Methanobacteriota archaeon]|nr:MAG: deoxyhypusine synthase [Euryarchaeota archaeon]
MTRPELKPIADIEVRSDMKVTQLLAEMLSSGGFTAKKLAQASEILVDMLEDVDCTVFLSFPACIISTGTRGVIRKLVEKNLVDALVTTCGTLDHDLARVWKDYYHGDFRMDDAELHRQDINRLGNILIPNDSYGIVLERRMHPVLEDLYESGKKSFSSRELAKEFGSRLDDRKSILFWAAKNDVPVFVPGITDGAFGSQLWLFSQKHRDFKVDVLKDEQELSDIVFSAKRAGALMIGGGISKHHVIWWNQFREGLDYAVYLTTAEEYDGSLSGARIREAVSWGKVKEKAKFITVEGDATITLPMLACAVLHIDRRGRD